MRIKTLLPTLLLAATLAVPALAANEVAGIVQANNGGTIYIGSNGRQFVASPDSVFLVGGLRVNPYTLQPGTPVQVYRGSSLTEVGNYYGGYHNDYYWRHHHYYYRDGYGNYYWR